MERVVGGEADAGEHLLAVRGDGARRAPGGGLGERRGDRRAGSSHAAPSVASSAFDRDQRLGEPVAHGLERARSAGRTAPASSAWRAREVEHGAAWPPRSGDPTARRPAATAASQAPSVERRAHRRRRATHADAVEPAVRVDPAHRRHLDGAPERCTVATPRRPHDHEQLAASRRERSRARSRAALALDAPGRRPTRRTRGSSDREVGARASRRARTPARRRARRPRAFAAPSAVNTISIASRGSASSISSQPSSASTASTRSPLDRDRARPRRARSPPARRDRRVHHSSLPELEEAAGDDVALHLGGAAVDRRGARVQVLAAPRCRRPRCRRSRSTPGSSRRTAS